MQLLAYVSLAVLIIFASLSDPASAAKVDELIAGAKKEGVLELYAASTLGRSRFAGAHDGLQQKSMGSTSK
jgi:hypothetical protein